MTTTEGNGVRKASPSRETSHYQWSRFLRRAIRNANLDGLEASVWAAAARYAEWPSKDRERDLKRAAEAFGIQPP